MYTMEKASFFKIKWKSTMFVFNRDIEFFFCWKRRNGLVGKGISWTNGRRSRFFLVNFLFFLLCVFSFFFHYIHFPRELFRNIYAITFHFYMELLASTSLEPIPCITETRVSKGSSL